MKKGGRPVKFDKIIIKKLEEAFLLDCSIPEACFVAGISKQTYYNHVSEKAKDGSKARQLFDRFESLRNNPIYLARKTVVEGIKINPDLAMKYLERKAKREFSLRVENTGAEGGALQSVFHYHVPEVKETKVLDAIQKKEEVVDLTGGESAKELLKQVLQDKPDIGFVAQHD